MIQENQQWPAFTFAYQPIVDVTEGKITSFEALVRGPSEQPAKDVLSNVSQSARYLFDELLRCRAIELACQLGINCRLNLNLLPKGPAMSETAIESALQAADEVGFDRKLVTLEITEPGIVDNVEWFAHCVARYRREGVRFAIDDFGKVYAGLNLIADFQPDCVKIDQVLIRDIKNSKAKRATLAGIVSCCKKLGVELVAEGVESNEEFEVCYDLGVSLFQGYLFAKPGFEILPTVSYPNKAMLTEMA